MGITGLLPFLKSITTPTSIKDYKGCTVAIDSYCWLHKGAFSCAEKLAVGEKTDQYVYYCMKYVNNLLSYGIKPIMVFDGCHLPSKKEVEKSRREKREMNRNKARQLLREERRSEARECLQRCIDITPEMALDLMEACRQKGVDCIVAPYEADAQLAYLNKAGIAQIIITEDSDLLLFGCDKIMFKMDFAGNGMMINSCDLHKAMKLRSDLYTFDKFRYMCILSGCDYLASLPGIGLGKANKLFQVIRQTDMHQVLKKLPNILNMSNLTVPKEYISGFFRANNTFLYQLVYDPHQRCIVPLNPYPPGVSAEEMQYAGPPIPPDKAYQIALGNINLYSDEVMAYFDPDTFKPSEPVSISGKKGKHAPHLLSIWDPSYRPMSKVNIQPQAERPSTKGKEVTVKVTGFLKRRSSPIKRNREQEEKEAALENQRDAAIMSGYTGEETSPEQKRFKLNHVGSSPKAETPGPETEETTATQESTPDAETIKCSKRNVFAVKGKLDKGGFKLDASKKIVIVKSRFFVHEELKHPKTDPFFSKFVDTTQRAPDSSAKDSSPGVKGEINKDQKRTDSEQCQVSLKSSKADDFVSDNTGSSSKNNSPYGSFGFGKKLKSFRSSFDKQKAESSLGVSSKVDSPYKPVMLKKVTSDTPIENVSDESQSKCSSVEENTSRSEKTNQPSAKSQPPGSHINTTQMSSQCVSLYKLDRDQGSFSQTSDSSNGDDDINSLDQQSSGYFSDISSAQNSPDKAQNEVDKSHNKPSQLQCSSGQSKRVSKTNSTVTEGDPSKMDVVLSVNSRGIMSKTKSPPAVRFSNSPHRGGCRSSGLTKRNSKTKTNKENQAKMTSYFTQYQFSNKEKPKVQSTKRDSLPLSPTKHNVNSDDLTRSVSAEATTKRPSLS